MLEQNNTFNNKTFDKIINIWKYNDIKYQRLSKANLTLSGTGQDIFILLNLLDQILSVVFSSKISKLFGGKNWHQSGYFDILLRSLRLIVVAP